MDKVDYSKVENEKASHKLGKMFVIHTYLTKELYL